MSVVNVTKLAAARNEPASGKIGFFEGEKWLVLTGLLGFLLAGVCGVWWLLFGGPVGPDGDVSHAFSFNAALGLFLLSTAAILPFSRSKVKTRAVFRWSYIALALYSYFAETVQNFRGVNPRFVNGGASFDVAVGNIFAFVALLLIVYYLVLAGHYFRPQAYRRHPELSVGIRYAMVAVLLSFSAGIWISMNQGRIVGTDGNIIWLHGLGFHALQVMPIVAWLAARASHTAKTGSTFIHITGISFILGLIAIGWQTYLGHSILAWSALPLAAAACFLISFASGAGALQAAFKVPRTEGARHADAQNR